MRINEAVQTIIITARELNQAGVSRGSDINAGQLSRWIKDGSNLSRNRQGELVIHLLEWFDALGEKRKKELLGIALFVEALQLLERFEPCHTQKAARAPLDPNHPVSPHHPAYVSRASDEILTEKISSFPHHITLVGGPRTGKSSLLAFLRERYPETVKTLLVDCYDLIRQRKSVPDLNLFYWLNQACEEQSTHPFYLSLRNPIDLPRWIQQSLLGGFGAQTPSVLLLDNLDALPPEDLSVLGIALHGLANAIRDEPSLRRFNLIMAYDEAAAHAFDFSRHFASSFFRSVQTINADPFHDGALKPFFHRVLGKESPLEAMTHSEAAWKLFAGHPYLTSQFACLVRDEEGGDHTAPLAEMVKRFDQHIGFAIRTKWGPELLSRVARAFLRGQRQEGRITIRTPELHGTEIEWLVDSCLFRPAGMDYVEGESNPLPGAKCTTEWIEAQLERFFREIAP